MLDVKTPIDSRAAQRHKKPSPLRDIRCRKPQKTQLFCCVKPKKGWTKTNLSSVLCHLPNAHQTRISSHRHSIMCITFEIKWKNTFGLSSYNILLKL